MFPRLALMAAARAGAVGQFIAPKAVQYGPRTAKIAKIAGKFAVQYVVISTAVDTAMALGGKVYALARRRKAQDTKFNFKVTMARTVENAKSTARFLRRSVTDGVAGAIFWLSLPVELVCIVLGALWTLTAGVIAFGATRVLTMCVPKWRANSINRSQGALHKVSRPGVALAEKTVRFFSLLVVWLHAHGGTPTVRDEQVLTIPEEMIGIVPRNNRKVKTVDTKDAPKPAVPPHVGQVTTINVTFDPAQAADDPAGYGMRIRDHIVRQGGMDAVKEFRPSLQRLIKKSGLQGAPAVRVMAGYDKVPDKIST